MPYDNLFKRLRENGNFVIGGPNLTSCFINILVDEGTEDPNTTISGPSSARQRNGI